MQQHDFTFPKLLTCRSNINRKFIGLIQGVLTIGGCGKPWGASHFTWKIKEQILDLYSRKQPWKYAVFTLKKTTFLKVICLVLGSIIQPAAGAKANMKKCYDRNKGGARSRKNEMRFSRCSFPDESVLCVSASNCKSSGEWGPQKTIKTEMPATRRKNPSYNF